MSSKDKSLKETFTNIFKRSKAGKNRKFFHEN